MANPFAYFTDMINAMGSSGLFWLVGGLVALLLVLWLIYRVVKSAVRAAIRESGLAVSQPHSSRSRRNPDTAYDFVYTAPRSEQ